MLLAIAEVVGGDWPKRASEAFAKLTSTDDVDAQGIGTTLLADIAAIFAAEGTDRVSSAKLTESLAAIEGRPWAEWGKDRKPISANQLVNQLRRVGISPDGIVAHQPFAGTLKDHKWLLLDLLRLPFVMAHSETLGETIFFCEDEDVEAGADEWRIYTKDELRTLCEQNRVAPLSPAETAESP